MLNKKPGSVVICSLILIFEVLITALIIGIIIGAEL